MRILKDYPPNIEEIKQYFVLKDNVVFAYDDTIYSPNNEYISEDLIAHELIHLAQQKIYGVEKWWNRYLQDTAFRASQEIEAYQAQYQFLKNIIKDRNALISKLVILAKDLSSELYGSFISFNEAFQTIKSNKKFAFKI